MLDNFINFKIEYIGFFITLLGVLIGIYQYRQLNKLKMLERELENLRTLFAEIAGINNTPYKVLEIEYPTNMATEYRIQRFRLGRYNKKFKICSEQSVYDNFFNYVDSTKEYISTSELTLRQTIELYHIFINNLYNRHLIDQTFQVLYSCIQGVINSKLTSNSDRIDRIERIKNSLSSRQLLFYFFNQVQYADRQRCENKFLFYLAKYHFFEKMFESQDYQNIQNLIPVSVEQLFFDKKYNK